MSFVEFYQTGGWFMHVVTVLTVAASAILVRRFKNAWHALRSPQNARLPDDDALTPVLALSIVMAGVLGAALGFAEVCAALQTVPPHLQLAAAIRGGRIMGNPLVWSLMCAIQVVLVHGLLRQLEARLRRVLSAA
jgi:hypothetical protein